MSTHEKDYLCAAAQAVERQAAQNPGLGIPLDPDVATYLGAFVESALSLEDLADDSLLSINAQGEVFYADAYN